MTPETPPVNPYAAEDDVRFEQIRASIAKRLTKSCAHLAPHDFALLVDKMVRVQIGKRLS